MAETTIKNGSVPIDPEIRRRLRALYQTAQNVDAVVRKAILWYRSNHDAKIDFSLMYDPDKTFAAAEWHLKGTRIRIRLVSLTDDLTIFWIYEIREEEWGKFIQHLADNTGLPISGLRTRKPDRTYITVDPSQLAVSA